MNSLKVRKIESYEQRSDVLTHTLKGFLWLLSCGYIELGVGRQYWKQRDKLGGFWTISVIRSGLDQGLSQIHFLFEDEVDHIC